MEPKSTSSRATRSSLACLPCRSRHHKCDGKRPCCDRCSGSKSQCTYPQSRRGGLDKAALAERRQRLAETAKNRHVNRKNSTAVIFRQSQDDLAPGQLDFTQEYPMFDLGPIATGDLFLQVRDTVSPINIETDPLVDSYYKTFHICHPFVLPKHHLITLHQDPRRQQEFVPLIAAIRLVGNIYKERELSDPLKEHLEASISQAVTSDPIIVQCRLLYSMALFWYEYKVDAKWQMDMANKLAVELQMFRCEFAVTQGADDLVLRESWRRTWWMLYIIEAYYAGTLGTMNFQVINIDATTVELPCDEADYESGNIPPSKTLNEFNCREFALRDIHFSSFAYLIGAVQCSASAISTTPTVVTAEDSPHIIQAADASLDGWLLSLPPDRKQVMNAAGEVDELMFQAHLVIHVSTIGLHRPLSALKFNAVESESSCARKPPIDTPTSDFVNVHTRRVRQAIEAQIQLLALPVRQFHHTPFTTCMVSEGTLALLSDCSFLLKGRELAIARDQIRMTIGCLKTLGEFWPRTARNVEEIQKIAQCVLGLACGGNNVNSPGLSDTPSLERHWDSSTSDFANSENEFAHYLGNIDVAHIDVRQIDDLCGWLPT
ncbi:unnamed protein product [Penicillium salamii]|nr:unnamed protein product [Penicillium salamii]